MSWNAHLPKAEFYKKDDPALPAIIAEALAQPVIAIDTETTGLTTWKCQPLFFSLSWGHRRFCLPADALHRFQLVFDDDEKCWVLANAKFDMHMLANAGIRLAGKIWDTQVMHAMLYEESPHSLDFMGKQLLGWQWKDMFESWDRKAQPDVGDFIMHLYNTDPQKLIEYASNDAYGTMRIFDKLKEELESAHIHSLYPHRYATLWDLFKKVEAPFTRVLWKCERNGILVDGDYLKNVSANADVELKDLERKIVALAGVGLNPRSPTQLRDYFFNVIKLQPIGYSKGGATGVKQPQTDYAFLEHYSDTVPLAALLLKHRDVSKLKGTYADGLPKFFDPHNRIHTRINQDVARTGRISSADPNLTNLPNSEQDRHGIRKAFISGPGKDLIVYDYSALEMRLLACASMEQDMINIFLNGWDIHMGNASMVFGLPYDDIKVAKKKAKADLTDYDHRCLKARSDVKSISFGLNYGMKENLLAKNLGCTVPRAIELMNQYMARYPAVAKFYEEAIAESTESGYAFSVLGRRRFLPEIISRNENDRWRAQRQAVNMQIQGSAADVVKMAMILIDEAGLDRKYGCHMQLQIHDELVFECPSETRDEAMAEIKEWMEHPLPTDLAVPLTVSGDHAKSWGLAK